MDYPLGGRFDLGGVTSVALESRRAGVVGRLLLVEGRGWLLLGLALDFQEVQNVLPGGLGVPMLAVAIVGVRVLATCNPLTAAAVLVSLCEFSSTWRR